MPLLSGVTHLRRAARQSMRRCSSPGTDGLTWAGYRQGLDDRLADLSARLRDGTWSPGPLHEVTATAFTGKEMRIVIPSVEDRIVHRAMRNAIEPVLEAEAFAGFVSGYRPGRNRLTSVAQAARWIESGCGWIADVDVKAVSRGATAGEVVDWLRPWVSDGTFLRRVRTALADLPEPIVPGTGLAPLLINLRLVRVDQRLAHLRVVRFCDNYCLFASTRAEAEEAFAAAAEALHAAKLSPSESKSRVHGVMNPEDLFLIAG